MWLVVIYQKQSRYLPDLHALLGLRRDFLGLDFPGIPYHFRCVSPRPTCTHSGNSPAARLTTPQRPSRWGLAGHQPHIVRVPLWGLAFSYRHAKERPLDFQQRAAT